MNKKIQPNRYNEVLEIYRQASLNTDGECCMVAPSPELNAEIKTEIARLQRRTSGVLGNMVKVKDRESPGMNDGMIYPGDMFPLGTPLRIARSAAADRAPLRGAVRVIVVLAQFSDKPMVETRQHFEELFFSTGILPHGSVNEYFKEATGGMVDIQGEVVGPYTLPKKIKDYANGASGTGSVQPNARTMALDAATAANPDVNFGPYDNDGDGFVDAYIVIHAGSGGEVTGSKNDIWSHKWVLPGTAPFKADSAKIYAYLTVPEDSKIGVCAHELGHLLFGFPDLYDTDYSSEGVGNWCLMGGGSWNGRGEIPAHPSAWCKVRQGWATEVVQKTNATVKIEDVKTSQKVYRLWKDGAAGKEYFLLENRQKTGYDAELPAGGLLVWHIDDAIDSNSDEAHPRVALVQADNKRDLEGGNNRGDAGDPFPGSTINSAFNASSTPNSNSYAHADTNVSVSKISVTGGVVSVQLAVKPAKAKEGKEGRKERTSEKQKEFFKDFFDSFYNWQTRTAQPDEALRRRSLGAPSNLEARLADLEARLAAIEPFIDQSQRPDLSESALEEEEDIAEIRQQMEDDILKAKRLFDSKPREY